MDLCSTLTVVYRDRPVVNGCSPPTPDMYIWSESPEFSEQKSLFDFAKSGPSREMIGSGTPWNLVSGLPQFASDKGFMCISYSQFYNRNPMQKKSGQYLLIPRGYGQSGLLDPLSPHSTMSLTAIQDLTVALDRYLYFNNIIHFEFCQIHVIPRL